MKVAVGVTKNMDSAGGRGGDIYDVFVACEGLFGINKQLGESIFVECE